MTLDSAFELRVSLGFRIWADFRLASGGFSLDAAGHSIIVSALLNQ